MAEVYMGARRFNLPSPSTVAEHPPMTDDPRALVLFFESPEQCAAWEAFLLAMAPASPSDLTSDAAF